MKTIKTLAAALCIATASLASVPAQAGFTLNGVKMNGFTLNGMRLNGMQLNGISFNGISFNGISFNGFTLNGTAVTGLEAGTPVAVTLPESMSASAE